MAPSLVSFVATFLVPLSKGCDMLDLKGCKMIDLWPISDIERESRRKPLSP